MRARWNALADRERQLLMLATGLLALLIIHVAILEPLHRGVLASKAERDIHVASSMRLQSLAQEAVALRSVQEHGALPEGMTLQGVLEDALATSGLRDRVAEIHPEGRDAVKASLRDTPLDRILQWLVALRSTYGIRVQTIDFQRAITPGTATVSVTLTRAY